MSANYFNHMILFFHCAQMTQFCYLDLSYVTQFLCIHNLFYPQMRKILAILNTGFQY